MMQNPNPSKATLQFYNKTKSGKKEWYDYTNHNFLLITEKASQQNHVHHRRLGY